jgi:hypothetical protein
MESDPNQTYNYSHEMILKSAFEMEVQHLKIIRKPEFDVELIESYLRDRIEEIMEHWK